MVTWSFFISVLQMYLGIINDFMVIAPNCIDENGIEDSDSANLCKP